MSTAAVRRLMLTVFFLSGGAGLIYEVVWMRELSLTFGVTTYAAATVLSIFMGGLAMGGYFFGRRIDRNPDPLVTYAWIEVGIGAYAVCVPSLLHALRTPYTFLRQLDLSYPALTLCRGLLAAAVLVLPTVLMGGTLPVLARAFIRGDEDVGKQAGSLYFVNTTGAIAGCLLTGFLLIEHLGLRGTTQVAAAMNLLCAAAAAGLARSSGAELPQRSAPARSHSVERKNAGVALLALVAIGVSGFSALGYEVLWTRALQRYLYNSTYAFTTMLATFLAGIALGSGLASAMLHRIARPLGLFALFQFFVAVGFLASAVAFANLPGYSAALLGGDVVRSFGESIRVMFVRASLVLFLPALSLGASFPVAIELCTHGAAGVGQRVGHVYAVNTVGAIAGSLAAAFAFIPTIGMQGTLVALITINLVQSLILAVASSSATQTRAMLGVLGTLAIAAILWKIPRDLFVRTFVSPDQRLVFYREGATDTVGVVETKGQRTIQYEDQRGTAGTFTYRRNFLLGHLPLLLHRGVPETVLHICFGVGNSLSAVAAHTSVKRVDNVELSPHVLEAAQYFWTNNNVLADSKVRTVIDDGRNFVMATRGLYDVIELEPPETFTAGVINLYTLEFYRDAADRLAPDGLMLQWVPEGEATLDDERRLFRAFVEVFPNATAWELLEDGHLLFIGGKLPFRVDYLLLKQKMQEERVQRDLQLIGIRDVDHLLSFFIFDPPAFAEFASQVPPVTDDLTVLDFSIPRNLGSGFGLGSIGRLSQSVHLNGLVPISAFLERNRYYMQHWRPIGPYLVDIGSETPEAIESRIAAHRKQRIVTPQPISQSEWHRW